MHRSNLASGVIDIHFFPYFEKTIKDNQPILVLVTIDLYSPDLNIVSE